MKSLVLLVVFAGIALSFGRTVLSVALKSELKGAEAWGHSLALGLGLGSLGTFFIGYAGAFKSIPVAIWWSLLAVLGIPSWKSLIGELRASVVVEPSDSKGAPRDMTGLLCGAVIVVLLLVSWSRCYVAPNGIQWDAISYHLADQKIFVQQGRIFSIPTEHHSNFPLIADTLFGIGLLFSDFALSNLFSLLFGLATLIATFGFTARIASRKAAWLACLLLVSTPVALWEFSVAYIDLALGLYVACAVFALVGGSGGSDETAISKREAALAGIHIGLALGCKYLGIVPFVLGGAYLLLKSETRKLVLRYALVALIVGCPWYVRNFVAVRNPVYPFAYSLFSSSKFWSGDRAASYQAEQDSFGEPHKISKPLETVPGLLRAPLRIVTHSDALPIRYSNPGENNYFSLAGVAIGLAGLTYLIRGASPAARTVGGFGFAMLGAWFMSAQVIRYLITPMPLFCVAAAVAVVMLSDKKHFKPSFWGLALGTTALCVIAGQSVLTLWGVARLPQRPQEAVGGKIGWSALSIAETRDALTDGNEARLRRTFGPYSAMEWINQNLPASSAILMYEEVEGFYLDRPYIWADYNHSSYIPYADMRGGEEYIAWARKHGYTHALINLDLAWRGRFQTDPRPVNQEVEAFEHWYAQAKSSPNDWRAPIYDAAKKGLLKPVFSKNGVIVLELTEARQ